jgi:hypothetical protein
MIDELVRKLELQPHPEGGYYRETYRAALSLETPRGARSAGTGIYYLLPRGTFAAFHRVTSDEVWHFYDGAPLALHLVDEAGHYERRVLGRDVLRGEHPQVVVKAGVIQAGEPLGDYALCGCTVAPGFDFADWRMPPYDELAVSHPRHRELFRRFTR